MNIHKLMLKVTARFILSSFLFMQASFFAEARQDFSIPTSTQMVATAANAVAQDIKTTTSTVNTTDANKLVDGQNHADLIALTQPSIVRILVHWKGTTTIPSFDIDYEKLAWSVNKSKTKQVPYDEYFTGSGFIFASDGYILTNSHVVSDAAIRKIMAAFLVTAIAERKGATITVAEGARLDLLGHTEEQFYQLGLDGVTFIENNLAQLDTPTIVVLAPTESTTTNTDSAYETQINGRKQEEIKKLAGSLMKSGVPASIVSVNNSFLDDEKDVAIIKVDQSNLPTINLKKDLSPKVGIPIYVFGFPASADYGGLSGEPSLTLGNVNSLKDSSQKTFKYIQTDAKISDGSSGGPVLDDTGEAVGIITIASAAEKGDGFAFAIPISIAQNAIEKAAIASSSGKYSKHLLAGISLERDRHCKEAIHEFQSAVMINATFGDVSKYVQPHIDACTVLIASGKSLDSKFDVLLDWIKNQGSVFWILVVCGILLFIVLIIFIIFLMRRMRREEKVIGELQDEMGRQSFPESSQAKPTVTTTYVQEDQTGTSSQTVPVMAQISTVDPSLLKYVRLERLRGNTDEHIRQTLADAGWNPADIDSGLAQQ